MSSFQVKIIPDMSNDHSIHLIEQASPWVRRFAPLVPEGGRVLDLACGRGRHTRLLAELGYSVEAVDRDPLAQEILQGIDRVHVRIADLEEGPWPYHTEVFDGMVVTNYLYRPQLPALLKLVAPQGVFIYETFMAGNERFGKPSNPAFLLRSGELLELVRNRFAVVAFEQGEVSSPRPAMVQRICAVRVTGSRLVLPG
jgi:SAM-dependent methyltransferase